MITRDDFQKFVNIAYFYLKFRSRTKKEIERYLKRKATILHTNQGVVEKVIAYLEEIGLVDDKKFVRLFVEQRKLIKPKGEYVLRGELMKLGIEKNLLDEYFSRNSLDEEELAHKTLVGRWPRYKNLESSKRFQKASQFMLRRGFNFDIIKKTIDKLSQE